MTVNVKELINRVPTGLLINNEWVDAKNNETYEVTNPATDEVLAELASAGEGDARAALDAACQAQADWARTSPRERADILRRAFELVHERGEEFAALMTLEMGKPLSEAQGEVTYGAEFLRWFSEETTRLYGRTATLPEGALRMVTRRKPVGPCLLITPWNFPLAMATRKVGPAVAAGCTMVLKPAKLTPLTAQYFAQTMLDAGLPEGVLNVVSGKSASAISTPLMADKRLRKVSFTGSTAVGRTLLKAAADNVLRTSMELGGNAPFIVFEDADIDQAVAGAMGAKMRNIGEACTAANRFLIHESVADEFTEKLVSAIKALKVGNGMEEGVTCGPLITSDAVENMEALVKDAVDHGGKVLVGGSRVDGAGNFFEPTVLRGMDRGARVFQEEIFGPLSPIFTFKTESEVVAAANDTEYGLASYVYTENSDRMWRLADSLEYGLMGYNAGVISNAAAPFGGVKQSGLGREGAAEGIEEYTSVQYIGVRDPYAGQ
ncbi:NAD-dependent succinate-semialdehyde dehydrogenase [Gleimia hominis]|uniref:NAD-dependent succinate-semialdehyde dehydrogenase n=1 Tax=Gleimia hominis TaxID=595468 RepID=A0ABU3IDL1_9ACTO|nr:NAD-dependent succinate-semialdehyde dehydrogenase [Gleimia hominis]MDT3768051.1 NAD-dependent succinate-semialdehyde dehydrogenase [Gleimia hominis]